ncbi:MAG: phage baseplate assembly protein V [Campylobacter sp.]
MRELFLGVICEVKQDESLVKVDYLGVKTKFVPYLQTANSFKRHFIPPRVGEQVILFDLGGMKVAIGSFFNQNFAKPQDANASKEITKYEDGTIISYDTASSTLEILNAKTLNLLIENEVNITCKNANLIAKNTTIKSPQVLIKGNTVIQGSISTTGEGGGSGSFEILGNVKIKGNLTTTGNITDTKGDLTSHSHKDTDGGTSLPR